MKKNISLTETMVQDVTCFSIKALQNMEKNLKSAHIDIWEQAECLEYSYYMLETIYEYLQNFYFNMDEYFVNLIQERFAKRYKQNTKYLSYIRNTKFNANKQQIETLLFICYIIQDAAWTICQKAINNSKETIYVLNHNALEKYVNCLKIQLHHINNHATMVEQFYNTLSETA